METDPNRLRLEMVDEQINTTSKAFLGLSVACARCHDHKTDPIPTDDYYALGGIFRSTRLVGDFSEFWRDGRVRQLRPLAMPDEVAANDAVRAADRREEGRAVAVPDRAARAADGEVARATRRSTARRPRRSRAGVREAYRGRAVRRAGQPPHRAAHARRQGRRGAGDADAGRAVGEVQDRGAGDRPRTGWTRCTRTDEGAPLYLQANGTTVTENALNEPTGGWDLKYQRWDTLGTFELRKGLNFLRLGLKSGNFPRLDRLRLIRAERSHRAADRPGRRGRRA